MAAAGNSEYTRAATYSRVSTQQQVQEGFNLAEYVRLTAEYVREKQWLLVEQYVDAGVSGRRNDRVEWNKLLSSCRAGQVDAVVVHALSRFSRSAGDAITRINELRGLGIDFISLKEAFDSRTANGRAMLGMTAVFAQLEAEQTAERSTLAQRAKAGLGLWPGGPAPYGWRLEGEGRDAVPAPDSTEREVLKIAVHHILADNGTTGSAAAMLNGLGYTGRKGGAWTHQRVLRTLTNPALKGEVAWAKPTRPYGHHTRLDARTGEPLWGPTVEFTIQDPPLDDNDWERLQLALARRRYGFKRAARPYPISGMLCPGGEDHSMGGVASRDRRTYRCRHSRWSADAGHARCPMPRIDAVWAEQAVANQVWALTDPIEVMAAARRYIRSLADVSDRAEAIRELATAEDALEKGRKGLRTALGAAIRGGVPEIEVEVIVGAAQAELVLLDRRVCHLRAACEAVPPDQEWAELMSRAVISLASKLNDASTDPSAFGSVISALGVKVRAREFANRPSLEVTATITRVALQDLLGDLGDVAQRWST